MSSFAASILKQLPQGQFKSMVRDKENVTSSTDSIPWLYCLAVNGCLRSPTWTVHVGSSLVRFLHRCRQKNGRKIAISNYAMLKVYADTCASVLKEKDIATQMQTEKWQKNSNLKLCNAEGVCRYLCISA